MSCGLKERVRGGERTTKTIKVRNMRIKRKGKRKGEQWEADLTGSPKGEKTVK